jgi:hypothetical protein
MGCKGSKDADEREARKIDYDFEWTRVPKFDDFFNTASTVLEKAEGIREGLQDAREDGAEFADTWKLKEYTYNDTVKVMFWALSANAGGDIKKANVNVSEEAPFVHLEYYDGLLWETRELADTFQAFLKSIVEGPGALIKIVEEVNNIVGQTSDLAQNGAQYAKDANLGGLDAIRAVNALRKNIAKLTTNAAKLKELPNLCKDGATDFKKLVPEIKKIVNECDEVGKKAAADKVLKPKDIFAKYHQGAKKTEAEIAAEAKKAEDLKKKREEKKKKKEAAKKAKADMSKGGAANTNANANANPPKH